MTRRMPLIDIRQILVIAIWICVSTIPITVTLSPSVDSALIEPTTTSTKDKTTISGPSDEHDPEINCPEYCECTPTSPDFTITARCIEIINATSAKPKIGKFVLEKHNVTLGPNDLHARGLDDVKSIGIMHPNQYNHQSIAETFPSLIMIDRIYQGTINIHPDTFQNNNELNFLAIYNFEFLYGNCDTTKNYMFNAPSLTRLFIAVSYYDCWSTSTFTKMSNLADIYIQSPSFKLEPHIFAPLHKLVKLEIHQAIDLENIGKDDLIDLVVLEKLVIRNHLKTIHEDAFVHTTQLKHLDISHNEIVSFTENHLRNNFRLEVLIMDDNNLKRLPVFKLSSANNTSYSIHKFHCRRCELESITDGTFNAMPALQELDLGNNHLQTLPRKFFKPLSSLQLLDLSNNLISNIPADMFESATNLLTLNLHRNPITTLEMMPFLQSPRLSSLDLSECEIKIWNPTSTPLKSLRSLSLTANKLKHITVEQLQTVPNLSDLLIFHNPIDCDDKLEDIIQWSQSHNTMTSFATSEFKHICVPSDNETCWDDFRNGICNPNYMSEVKLIRRNLERILHDDNGAEEKPNNGMHQQLTVILLFLSLLSQLTF